MNIRNILHVFQGCPREDILRWLDSIEKTTIPSEKKILIVEDDSSVRRVIRRALEGVGYDCLVTADGQQALAAFRQHPGIVDLIVSDLVMPNMDGPALYEQLGREAEPRPPFLFVSGHTDQDARVADLVARGIPILHKPWSVLDLCEAVRTTLGRIDDSKESDLAPSEPAQTD